MKVATVAVAYREARLIGKHLDHIPDWVDEKLVLVSQKPWFGEELPDDGTAQIARDHGATVIEYEWKTEEEQRNAGQEYLSDYDWIIVLDPDEFLDDKSWKNLKGTLEEETKRHHRAWDIGDYLHALVVAGQYTYWKNGYVADPPRDYQMLIAVTPLAEFVDKRVVGCSYGVLQEIWIHHFSWAKTDKEVLDKISHYAHAKDFDVDKWYNEVWLKWKPGMQDVHPTTPETLHNLIPAKLPPELERLDLWPQ